MTVFVSLSSTLRQLPLLSVAMFATLFAQYTFANTIESPAVPTGDAPSASLPDSPGALLASQRISSSNDSEHNAFGAETTGATIRPTIAPRVKFIAADRIAPKQQAHDKFLLGLRESVTPFAVIGWLGSAGWSQLIDGPPNYGTNGTAFAQRFGAAAALSSSKEIFSDSILATAFHQDPRYYQLGNGHGFLRRALYAATRPIIGRTDSGKTIPNYAFILGSGGAAGLTRAYYPERNQSGGQFARTWATTLGGSAVGSLVSEFGGGVIGWLRVGRRE